MRIVVVGASLAGVRTVQALRRLGSTADVTIVDGASAVACDRPPLSKGFLADPAAQPRPVATPEQLADLDVRLLLGSPAQTLDVAGRRVGLGRGETLEYDALVVATGSAPRTVPGLPERDGVHVLRTAEHANALRSRLVAGTRLVVVGGGFIGSETAWTASRLGVHVTVVEPLPTLMVRGLGAVLGELFTQRHRAAGVETVLGTGVASVDGVDRVEHVRLADGRRLPADVVLVGVGTVPQTSWLEGSGLEVADGLVCDEQLRAVGTTEVYGAGDVARWWNPRFAATTRVEHWTNAVEQSAVVAANLLGGGQSYDALPYVWSDQLGARLQVFGRVRPQDDVRFVVGDRETPSFVAVAGDGTTLSAVVGFGATRDLMPYRALLLAGGSWSDALALAGTR